MKLRNINIKINPSLYFRKLKFFIEYYKSIKKYEENLGKDLGLNYDKYNFKLFSYLTFETLSKDDNKQYSNELILNEIKKYNNKVLINSNKYELDDLIKICNIEKINDNIYLVEYNYSEFDTIKYTIWTSTIIILSTAILMML